MSLFKPFSNVELAFGTRESSQHIGDLINSVNLKQIHSDRIHIIEKPFDAAKFCGTEGDALITALPDITLLVRTADCVPILIAHPEGIIAAVHAGWRGTSLKILFKTLEQIKKKYAPDMQKIQIYIGPCICKDCYEIGEEVVHAFENGLQDGYIERKDNKKFNLDLKTANVKQALAFGIAKGKIIVSGHCTLCECAIYYSYRASGGGEQGRNHSWIRRLL